VTQDQADAAAAEKKADWIEEMLERARQGDRSVLPAIREALESPDLTEALGNFARRVQAALVESAAGGNLAMSEAMNKKLDGMRAELSRPDPTPVERQLVERVVVCWLVVHEAELRAALAAKVAPEQGPYWEKRIDRAHKRHLSAIKMLATVRKLALPAVRVNVARK